MSKFNFNLLYFLTPILLLTILLLISFNSQAQVAIHTFKSDNLKTNNLASNNLASNNLKTNSYNQSRNQQQTKTSTQPSIKISNNFEPCWDEAARYHGIDPWLLYAVAYVESTHNPTVISKPNRNGSYDIGLMQINSNWLPTLRRYGITQSTLKNACASTFVGAWVMASNIRRYGYSWQAIAAYNVGSLDTPARKKIGYSYAKKVYRAYDGLVRRNNSK